MTLSEATRQLQWAIEYRRIARELYTTDEELRECDEAVKDARDRTVALWLHAVAT
jgi:hypothetical protein